MSKNRSRQYSFQVFFLIMISIVVVACGSTSANTPPTPKPTATPSPTPTVTLTTYNGTGYTIGYPQGWTLAASNKSAVSFLDTEQNGMIVETKTGAAALSSSVGAFVVSQVLDGMKLAEKNLQNVKVPAKITLDGATWDQGAATMIDTKTNKAMHLLVLGTQNPKKLSQLFIIICDTTQTEFDKINATDLQPMLKSFKFQA